MCRTRLLLLSLCCACTCGTPAPTTVVTANESGLVTIEGLLDDVAKVAIRNAEVRVRIDGVFHTTRGAACVAGLDRLLDCDVGNGLKLRLDRTTSGVGHVLVASVAGPGEHVIDGFEVLSTTGEDAALEVDAPTGQLRYLHNGYQSWSFAGALDLPGLHQVKRTSAGALVNPGVNGSTLDEKMGVSNHDVILDTGEKTALVVGFIDAARWHGAVALESDSVFRIHAFNGFTGESVPLAGEVKSEPLLVQFAASPQDAMLAYGVAIDALPRQPRVVRDFGQRGWFSWNRYFLDITEPILFKEAAALKTLAGKTFPLVEIDDGWERDWGDWTPNEKFRPIADLAADLKTKEQTLGLWLAPFVVEESNPIVAAHPDWFVQSIDGGPLVHTPVGLARKLHLIDTTHPDALAWAVGNLTRLATDGVVFFKLDFLYATAFGGKRHDPGATGASALRTGLDAVFKALPNAGINLCGVPWLTAARSPWSSIRVGPDVAFNTGPYGFVFVAAAARNLAARAFGPISARSDVDQFKLAPLTEAETRTAVFLQAVLPDTFALGDGLVELPEAKKALVQAALELAPAQPGDSFGAGASLEVPGIFDAAGAAHLASNALEILSDPNKVQSVVPSTVTGKIQVITNWGDAPLTIEPDLSSRRVMHGTMAADGTLTIAPHDSAVLVVRMDD